MKLKKSFNKRGMGVIAVGLIALVGLILVGLFFVKVDPLQKRILSHALDRVDAAQAQGIINDTSANYSGWMDGAFLFLFGGLWIGSLWVGYHDDYGLFWMMFIFLMMVFLLGAAGHVSNYWERVTDAGNVATSSSYPYTYFILNNLMWAILLVVGSGVVVSVVKD